MVILDLDLDFFLDNPVKGVYFSSEERVMDEACANSVWSEDRVRVFFENNLGLSKTHKIPGRVVCGHDEALYFWDELIQKSKLNTPFSVIHIDSHADLDFGGVGKIAVLEEIIHWPLELRKPSNCHNIEIDNKYYDIDIGNYLLFALVFRWISDLTYCGNPNWDCGDFPAEIIKGGMSGNGIDEITDLYIQLKPRNLAIGDTSREPMIPFKVCPRIEDVCYKGDFDFVSIAKSPNYTPQNADYILEVIKEYITEI